jgi:hypothetical protein
MPSVFGPGDVEPMEVDAVGCRVLVGFEEEEGCCGIDCNVEES